MVGANLYRDNSVATLPPGRMVVALYDGAIKFLNRAVYALEQGDVAQKGVYISKAIAVIDELDCSLNMDAGGEIAQNLRSLYVFMVRHLQQANMQKDPQKIREVISLLTEVNSGWKAVTA